jgi:hypothetical protein
MSKDKADKNSKPPPNKGAAIGIFDGLTSATYRKCYPARMPLKSATLRG